MLTEAQRRNDRIKMAIWPLALAGIYGFFMQWYWEGGFPRSLGVLMGFLDWLLVEPLGFWGSVALVAGLGYLPIGFLLVGNDPHGERAER